MAPTLTTTTNNTFRLPTAANNGTDFSTGIADLASDVDAMWSSGTLAARPSAGTRGRAYYATDTGLRYFDTGAAWQTALLAAAWQSLTSGANVVAGDAYSLSARAEGDVARLRGLLAGSAPVLAGSTLATIPAGLRPLAPLTLPRILQPIPWAASGTAARLFISTTGVITSDSDVNTTFGLSLHGITYTLS